jgi:hypothetical protein
MSSEPRHIHADEIPLGGPRHNVYLDGVLMEPVVEVLEGPRGFVVLDPTFWQPHVPLDAPDSLVEDDESDPGPAWILFGNVTLEPIP